MLTTGANTATYLYRVINCSKSSTATVSLGSDDGIAVWLNGRKVLSHDVPRGVSAGGERFDLRLKAGKNEFLMKIYNNSGACGFYFSLVKDLALSKLWKSIEEKYPVQAGWVDRDLGDNGYPRWFNGINSVKSEKKMIGSVLKGVGGAGGRFKKEYDRLVKRVKV